jgi:hypothetical protein
MTAAIGPLKNSFIIQVRRETEELKDLSDESKRSTNRQV